MGFWGQGRAGFTRRFKVMDNWTILLQVMMSLVKISTGDFTASSSENQDEPRQMIRIATIQTDPFVRLNWSPGLIANERYEGLYIDLLRQLARDAGFDYQLYLVPDGKTGQLGENNERWNGLIGELERGSADLALAPVVATNERRQAVHFLSPLSRVKISLLSRDHRQRHLPYCVVIDNDEFYAIRNNEPLYTGMRNHGIKYTTSIMEALDKTRDGSCNLLLSSQLADYHADQEPCDLTAQPFHTFDDLVYSLATRGSGEMSDDISEALDRLALGTSLMETLEQRWLRGSCMRKGTIPTSLGTTTNAGAQRLWNKLVISSILSEPYLMRSNKRGVEFEGYIADLVHQVARVLAVDYEWRIQRRVGRRKSTGAWNGMIGDVTGQESDLAAAPFIISDDHQDALSFSKPFLESTLSLVIKAPPDGRPPVLMVEDLLNQSAYEFGVVHSSRLAKQLRHSQLPIYKQLWSKLKNQNKDAHNRIVSIPAGLDRVRKEHFALLLESTEATYLASRRPCDLLSLSQYLVVTNYAFATVKGSPLMEHLNLALLQLQEQGVLQALFHKWWNTDECVGFQPDPELQPEEEIMIPTPPLDNADETTTTPQTTAKTTITTSTTTTPVTTSSTTTQAPFKPILDFDLDAILGLSTERDPYPYAANESDYEDFDDLDRHDLDRIFLTSPISPFTPMKHGDKDSTRLANTTQSNNMVTMTPPGIWNSSLASTRVTESLVINKTIGAVNLTTLLLSPVVNDRVTSSIATEPDSPTPLSTTVTLTTTKKSRRRGRTRKPKRRHRGRKRSTTTPMVTQIPTTTTTHAPKSRDRSREFDKNLDWFFATELPRPDEYDDYDTYNMSKNDNFTSFTSNKPQTSLTHEEATASAPQTTPIKTTKVDTIHPIDTTSVRPLTYTVSPTLHTTLTTVRRHPSETDPTIHSVAPPRSEPNTAVLMVVIIHLVIFGWPSEPTDCTENCHR